MTPRAVGGHAVVIDEMWIPAGPWTEIAVYDPALAVELLTALHAEMTVRLAHQHARKQPTEALPLLVVGADDLPALAAYWREEIAATDREPGDHDQTRSPGEVWTALAAHGRDAAIELIIGIPTGPKPRTPAAMPIGPTRVEATVSTVVGQPRSAKSDAAQPVPVWRTQPAPTRTVLAYQGRDPHTALLSPELAEFVEWLQAPRQLQPRKEIH
ncbi:hypothetical protein [Nocardia tengchongensis]|uniref:hypothetical protein n=1 Tax=Nocardia tengchongensis TaxID=2055889 RepID=UPI003660626D